MYRIGFSFPLFGSFSVLHLRSRLVSFPFPRCFDVSTVLSSFSFPFCTAAALGLSLFPSLVVPGRGSFLLFTNVPYLSSSLMFITSSLSAPLLCRRQPEPYLPLHYFSSPTSPNDLSTLSCVLYFSFPRILYCIISFCPAYLCFDLRYALSVLM